jgi:hypothetical protein
MEPYKIQVSDITYMSELTPPLAFCKNAAGLIHALIYSCFAFVSYALIK